ncbi:MAG: methionine--tRNA ligase [Patescibacteria group bacterium]|jgi:methionyl-tRNA synthetase
MNKEKFYVTTPIYYVNGEPHIGSAYTTIAADVLARFHRMKGEEVFFLTGTDEHGTKVAQTAQEQNLTPQEFTDIISSKYQLAWDILDISNDDFIRTTSQRHKDLVKIFVTKLKEVGAIYEGEYEGLYCVGCERFLTEKELVNGECPDHKKKPELIKEKNYFFNLKKYLPEIEEKISSDEIRILPEKIKKEVLGLFKQGLNDFSVTREKVKWGIEVPFDSSQVVYVWADALLNYITALGYGSKDDLLFRKFWPANLHLMAKEIIKFHAIFWPAMLLAVGEELPQTIFAHGFFTVDGQKMSKSLGNAIDPMELVKQFGSDATRFMLLSQFPFGQDGDVKVGNFVIQYNSDLANGVGNLTSRVLTMAEKYFDGIVPEKDSELAEPVKNIWSEYEKAMTSFEVDKAIEAIKKLNGLCDAYVEENKPWQLAKDDKEKLSKVIYNLLEALRHLGVMLYPIMPQTSQKILQSLGKGDFTSIQLSDLQNWGRLQPGAKVSKAEALFPRIQ